MASISIKLPANLTTALAARRGQDEPRLVPWLAAWMLADHRIGGGTLPGELGDTASLLALARQHVDNGRNTWEGETGLALFVEEAAPTGLPAETDAVNAMPVGHDAIPSDTESSTSRKKADISLHFVGEDVTIGSPSGRYDAVALHGWRRLLRHLLIELVLQGPQQLRQFSNLATNIRPLVLQTWSGPTDGDARLPQATVIERFDLQCRRHPDATAVRMPGTPGVTWSYETLREISLRHAARLQALDVGAGDRVAMLLSRRPEAIALMLGILRLGAVYVPIDPASPEQRLSLMLEDSQPTLLLVDSHTQPHQLALAKARGIPTLDIEGIDHDDTDTLVGFDTVPCLSERLSEQELARYGSPARQPAYVMYTSGSTGTPKGVVIPHRAIVRLVYRQYYAPLGPKVVMLHAAPLAFDASTLEIWGPLLNGGTCVVHPQAIPSGAGLAETIRTERVNTAWLTAALFNRIVDEDPLHLQGLRTLMTGGEALSPRHVRRALQALPGLQLINGYGPTETTTFAVTGPVSEHDLDSHASVPLGRPINWTYVRVLSPLGDAVPPGLTGELYIGGPGVALGYLNRPDLTKERFVADPFGGPHDVLYRTGDAVRWLDDGRLEYLGRLDGQLKIRGFRIEPGEIEAVLASHPAVANAAITDECPPNGERRLVAWLVAAAGQTLPDDDALRDHCRQRLPIYMMPARFVAVPQLPITLNGKLDRRALQAMETKDTTPVNSVDTCFTEDTEVTDRDVTGFDTDLAHPNQNKREIAASAASSTPQPVSGSPRTTETSSRPDGQASASSQTLTPALKRRLEQRIIALLEPILAIRGLRAHDNFFEVGGSSLLAAQALEALQQTFGPAIGIEDFFGTPTVTAFAARIAEGLPAAELQRILQPGSDTTNTGHASHQAQTDTASHAGTHPDGQATPVTDGSAPHAAPADQAHVATPTDEDERAIAIIGMAGRFPGAASIEELWQNLIAGRDGIRHFRPEELDPSLPASLTGDPDYVAARGVLDDAARFDAAFFGIGPREAELMDPQQRIFLELAWQCLEQGGQAPRDGNRQIGVFAGMYNATYFQRHLQHYPEKIAALGEFQVMLDNEKDYIATRTANRLDLRGPAVSVHTACSTSLVAIVQAVQALRAGQCRMALAGGVAVTAPVNSGYRHEAGSMLSPDGFTRSFDADAQGTVFSDGAAVVLLKRLADARRDGDTVYAVIRGVGINNDGGNKASFTAVSVEGQHAVIRAALDDAGVPARSIQVVEAHGTATPMGDPVEVRALTRAWREETQDTGFAVLSSLKSYIGHTVIAAGASATIKTVMALQHNLIPGTLHFRKPNPGLQLEQSPFRVTAEATPWPATPGTPRRAAISAFGVGGTNAHIIIEEAPADLALGAPASSTAAGTAQAAAAPSGHTADAALTFLPLSARTPTALATQRRQLAEHLRRLQATQARTDAADDPADKSATRAGQDADPFLSTALANLSDISFTLAHGRSPLPHRQCVLARTLDEAIAALENDSAPDHIHATAAAQGPLVWLFPGQGAQYAAMGRQLYEQEPVFARAFDEVAEAIGPLPGANGHPWLNTLIQSAENSGLPSNGHTRPDDHAPGGHPAASSAAPQNPTRHSGADLRALVFHGSEADLAQTALTQPALFAIEYALARWWQHQGLLPDLLVGHSLGEFTAAVIAGVMPVADAARLVALRGQLIQALPAGAMLAVRQPAAEVAPRLPSELSIATINAPEACVVAGPEAAIDALARQLEAEGVANQRLKTSHAFHSAMMEPAVSPFERAVSRVSLSAPTIPIISGRTGRPLTDAEATDPHWWAAQLRDTVRFADAVQHVLAESPESTFLEVGPGRILVNLVRRAAPARKAPACVASLESADDEVRSLARAHARMWCLDRLPAASLAPVQGRRIPLPTYPFEGKRYWLDAPAADGRVTSIPPAAYATCGAQARAVPLAATPSASTAPTATNTLPARPAHPVAGDQPLAPSSVPVAASVASTDHQGLISAAEAAIGALRAALQAHAGQSVQAATRQTADPARHAAPDAVIPPATARAASPQAATAVPSFSENPNLLKQHTNTMSTNDRQARLHQELADTIDEVCGITVGPEDRDSAFVDLGLDSLLLTQLALQIKRHFNAPISFRQLMTDLPSPNAVVQHLDGILPADAAVAAPAADSTTAAAPQLPAAAAPTALQPAMPSMPAQAPLLAPLAPAGAVDGVSYLLSQQLQLMENQLRLLTGQPAMAASAQAVITATDAPVAPPAAQAPTVPAVAASASSAPSSAEADERPTDDPKRAFGAIARIYRQQHDALTPRQEARLDAFIKRYVDRTRASRDYTQQHRPHSADPRVVNGFRPRLKEMIYQIVIGRSKGSHLWDLDGNEYVDALNGFGMSLFGWQPDFVLDAVRHQLDLGYEIGPQHPLAGPVTELVCEMTGFDRAALCNTGSEAVMGAVRIARTVTGRERIAVFAGSYHGIFDEVIVRLGARGRAMPAAPGIMPNTAANVVILEYGEPDALQWVRDNADNLAAVLVEPVQSRRPDLQPREFLHELRRITAESGSLLIFDEVVTGFRTGPGGAQAHFDVRADLASYGKVIGGGFPIGIIAGKRQYMDALDGGAWQYGDDSIPTVGVTYFAGTFVRHPLALAACHAVLTYLKEAGPELQRKLTETTTKLADSLNAFCQEHGAPIAVKHFASVWRIVFTEDHPYQDLLFAMMRSRGIHILDNFPCFMTTAHSEADVEAIRKAFCDSVLELQADGFLPGKPVQNAADASASFDPTKPPVPGARLGRDAQGKAAWFIADPDRPGSYMQLKTSV